MENIYKNYVNSIKSKTSKNIEKPSFDIIKPLLFFYHKQLLKMSVNYISTEDKFAFEGGMSSFNGVSNTPEEMVSKMKNIFYLAQECDGDVLEVGFNAGNSAIIFLLANPNLHIYAYDICYHSYVEPCVKYLNSIFNNRITLIKGNSQETLSGVKNSNNIQIFHMDGCHNESVVKSDMKNLYENAKKGSYLILDDTDQDVILKEYNEYVFKNRIKNCKLKYECKNYKHLIGRYI